MPKEKQTNLSRRRFLQLTALGTGGLLAAACVPTAAPGAATTSEDAGSPSMETIDLRLSAWADVQDAVVYENMVSAYHEKNEGVNVSVEQYPGGYYEKIQANFAANTPADIIYYQGWKMQAFADNDVLVGLDDFIKGADAQGHFPDGENYENQTRWQGNTYMTPTDTGSLVVYYNKDLFDRRSIPYPQENWKYEEFQQMMIDLSFEEDGRQYYGWGQGQGWNGSYGRNTNWMRRNGHVEWDRINEPTVAVWDHPDIVEGLQFMVYDAITNGWSPSPDVIAGGGVGVDTGRVAMYLEGPWVMPRLRGDLATTEEGINFDVIAAPTGTAGRNFTFGHVHGHVMSAASEHQDVAWDVIAFILGDEGQTIIAQGGRMCGTPDNIQNIWGDIASATYGFTNTAAFADTMRDSSISVIFGEGSQMDAYGGGPVGVLWDKLLAQTDTAAEALKVAQVDIQDDLDKYWADRA